jgi:hypothetical protein
VSDIEELRTELAKRSHGATMPFFISKEDGAAIVAALARLTAAESRFSRDDARLFRIALLNYIPPPSDRDRAVGLIAKLEEMEKKK